MFKEINSFGYENRYYLPIVGSYYGVNEIIDGVNDLLHPMKIFQSEKKSLAYRKICHGSAALIPVLGIIALYAFQFFFPEKPEPIIENPYLNDDPEINAVLDKLEDIVTGPEKKENYINWYNAGGASFYSNQIPKMSQSQLFHLTSITSFIDNSEFWLYRHMIPKLSEDKQCRELSLALDFGINIAIDMIERSKLSKENQALAFARFISHNRHTHPGEYSLENIKEVLGIDFVYKIAPYLNYVDVRGLEENEINKILLKCPNIQYLLIDNKEIKKLPIELPFCRVLCCGDCSSLIELPPLPSCIHLQIDRCRQLRTVQELLCCIYCEGSECVSLTTIALPIGEKVYLEGCTNLTEIPPLLRCRVLNIRDCPNLSAVPVVPITCSIYSNHGDSTKMVIDFDNFIQNPKKLLMDLGNYLLNNLPFPNIYYFSEGKQSVAIDAGGVRRDFLTRLLENLFKEVEGKITLIMSKDKMPMANEDPENEICYRILGRLFAFCYPQHSSFKTGPLFNEMVYTFIADPSEGDEWYINCYFNLMNIPQNIKTFITLNETKPELTKKDLDYVTLLDETFVDTKEHRKVLREEILQKARKDAKLRPLAYIRDEMKKILTDAEMNMISQAGPKTLQERIEGLLTADLLLNKLNWVQGAVSHQDLVKIQVFFTKWINEAKFEQLTKFVRTVTGNSTLSSHPIKIELYNRDIGRCPNAHTCFMSLEVPAGYPNQKHFNDKLNECLVNSLHGDGFQTV